MSSSPKIAIIGAGPSGLLLARMLQQSSLPFTLYDLDPSRQSRDQGGMLDLHRSMGQLALQRAGLTAQFLNSVVPGAEAMKLIKSNGEIPWDENTLEIPAGLNRDRPEIDRRKLRDLLIDSVVPGNIRWARKLVSVEASSEEGKYDLVFSDGVEKGFDLVVGADGAWSRVRPLLSDTKPFYSGITGVELWARNASQDHKWLAEFTGKGTLFMFDDDRMLGCQHNGDDTIRVYPAMRVEETWLDECGIDWTNHAEAKEELVKRFFADCAEDIKRAIREEHTDAIIPRKLYMLPVGIRWEGKPGLTLVGDAAHLMTPFAGVGVNVALTDAMELAQALIRRKDELATDAEGRRTLMAEAIKEYEESMFVRAKENMQKTAHGLEHHFSKHGIDERANRMKRALADMQRRAKERKAESGHSEDEPKKVNQEKTEEIGVVREELARQKLE